MHSYHRIHHRLHRLEGEGGVHKRCNRSSHAAHKVGAGEHGVAEHVMALAHFQLCGLDDVAYLHSRRAGHLAALAVEAVLESILIKNRVLQTVALTVWSGLLRSGIELVIGQYGTNRGADCTLLALFEIMCAYVFLLHTYLILAAASAADFLILSSASSSMPLISESSSPAAKRFLSITPSSATRPPP